MKAEFQQFSTLKEGHEGIHHLSSQHWPSVAVVLRSLLGALLGMANRLHRDAHAVLEVRFLACELGFAHRQRWDLINGESFNQATWGGIAPNLYNKWVLT